MISPSTLRDAMVGDHVAFDKDGVVLDVAVPGDAGPATLVVSELTDAVKRVEGARVVESVDRAQVWVVDAIVLDRVVLDSLGVEEMGAEELLEAVREAGYGWQVSSTSAP